MKNFRFIHTVAFRYLFSRKSHNTINLITIVSMCGVAIGAMALICVLSVINGFEKVVQESFNNFDPDLRIKAKEGRFFSSDDTKIKDICSWEEVKESCRLLEVDALLQYRDKQMPAKVIGVDDTFSDIANLDSIIWDGDANFKYHTVPVGIMGIGLANKLECGVGYTDGITLYAPKRHAKINMSRPDASFSKYVFYTCGIFYIGQSKYDDNVAIIPIEYIRDVYDFDKTTVTAINLKLNNAADAQKTEKLIEAYIGDKYYVDNRYEQQEDFYKIFKIEKWTAFLILLFIFIIATFNVIGSMSMLMINKKEDILLFKNLGASKKLLEKLFIFEGWMISVIGAVSGLSIGIAVCLIQEKWGIIKIGTGYIVDTYPVALQITDVIIVFISVLLIGIFAAIYPVKVGLKVKKP